ncbi:GNAT family N-acetyltransferase [Streptomyces sp. NPDC002589]|uniref:GNAT family N-acetyltransferase n=1 Tax=Streptomyces sp. NPDC002589 TaxID=3154420 RepID=UPI00332700EE
MRADVQSSAVARLLRRPAACEVGGFVVGFDPSTTSPYVNYATPFPHAEADYTAVDIALAEAFGGGWEPSPEGAARLRRAEESGGAVRFVRAPGGGCAGGALCSAPAEGTAEMAGVGTLPRYRGRGIAATVTSAPAGTMFGRGAESVWLECSGEGSRRVYERVGFRPGGTRLYVSLEGYLLGRGDGIHVPAGSHPSSGKGWSLTKRRISSVRAAGLSSWTSVRASGISA